MNVRSCNSVTQSLSVPERRKATTLSEATVAHRHGGFPQGATMKLEGRKPDNQIGKRYGRLRPVSYVKGSRWECVCDCGNIIITKTSNLANGHSKSCGCLSREITISRSTKHGHTVNMRPSRTWRSWCDMLRRCKDPKRDDYYLYGGRGITVCQAWEEFAVFWSEMGYRPDGMSLGRIDNSKGYCKNNCRWETPEQQANNKRSNRLLTVGEQTKTVSQWAVAIGVSAGFLFSRLAKGWSDEEAIRTPFRTKRNSVK